MCTPSPDLLLCHEAAMQEIDRSDPYHLQRFVDAQATTFEQARNELQAGHKTGHWMWFIFPQIVGLGHSPLARKFAISSREVAQAYMNHPILGPRLRDCTMLVTHRALASDAQEPHLA
jgi:uncharacterized protein (DUF1810 family)